MKMERDVVGQS